MSVPLGEIYEHNQRQLHLSVIKRLKYISKQNGHIYISKQVGEWD